MTVIDLGTLGGPNSAASAINTQAFIVGASETSFGTSTAVIWPQGIAPPVALPVLSNRGHHIILRKLYAKGFIKSIET
ncbi:TPA: hypothetical protein ROY17_005584 [Bacillus thuringiensis]|nr:hypothetical protein [Bacillus thuringiensis]